MSQVCLLPTDWSFVNDVVSDCLVSYVTPTEAVTTAGLSDSRALAYLTSHLLITLLWLRAVLFSSFLHNSVNSAAY